MIPVIFALFSHRHYQNCPIAGGVVKEKSPTGNCAKPSQETPWNNFVVKMLICLVNQTDVAPWCYKWMGWMGWGIEHFLVLIRVKFIFYVMPKGKKKSVWNKKMRSNSSSVWILTLPKLPVSTDLHLWTRFQLPSREWFQLFAQIGQIVNFKVGYSHSDRSSVDLWRFAYNLNSTGAVCLLK